MKIKVKTEIKCLKFWLGLKPKIWLKKLAKF